MTFFIVSRNSVPLSAWLDQGLAKAEVVRLDEAYGQLPQWKQFADGEPRFEIHEIPLMFSSDHGGTLVLSRFLGENIVIEPLVGDPIHVQLVDIRGDRKARIGVKAQKGVRVDRQEVYEARQREKARQAALAEKRQEGPSNH